MEIKKLLKDLFAEMEDNDVVKAYRLFLGRTGRADEMPAMNRDEKRSLLQWFVDCDSCGISPDFCKMDEYYYLDRHGNLCSFNDLSDEWCPVDVDALVDHIAKTGDDVGNYKVSEFLGVNDPELKLRWRKHAERMCALEKKCHDGGEYGDYGVFG